MKRVGLRTGAMLIAVSVLFSVVLTGCSSKTTSASAAASGKIVTVGAENEYADVLWQFPV